MTVRVTPVNLGSIQRAMLTGGVAVVDRLYLRGCLLYGDSHLSVGGVVSARGGGRDNNPFYQMRIVLGIETPIDRRRVRSSTIARVIEPSEVRTRRNYNQLQIINRKSQMFESNLLAICSSYIGLICAHIESSPVRHCGA